MRSLLVSAGLIGTLTLGLAVGAAAQDLDPWDTPEPERRRSYDRGATTGGDLREERPLSARFGMGFTADPSTFLMGLEVDYHLMRAFSVGTQLHLGFDEDHSLVAPVAFGRYHLYGSDFEFGEFVDRMNAYGHVGLGINYQDFDGSTRRRPRRDDDDLEFMWNTGVGVEYVLNDEVSINSQMMLNFIPDGLFGDHSYFSWEIVGVRYRF